MKITIVLVATLLGAACATPQADPPAELPVVHVTPVATGTLSEWLRLPGRVVPPPDRDATLSLRTEGILTEVTARLGTRVARGRVLARVDTAPLDEALAAADAAVKSAAADADVKRRVATR